VFVIGDLDLVRPLRMVGERVVAVAAAGSPTSFSSEVEAVVALPDPYTDEALIVGLERAASGWARTAPLFFQGDRELLALSAARDRLSSRFSFVLPPHELVLDLVLKDRFQRLAERLGLPVPPAAVITGDRVPHWRFTGPVVVKPLTRAAGWGELKIGAKAIEVSDEAELLAVIERLQPRCAELLVQQLVGGPESSIESYHAYIDADGAVVGEFTGRKLRTYPARYGFTTALTITDQSDVRALGREVLTRLGFTGVAKLDFKRDPDGHLWLLEVNPRFNLWHHPGAAAGVNLPALVLADLTGRPRPVSTTARPGVTWCDPLHDLRAARADHISVRSWLGSALRCDTYGDLKRHDALPFVRGDLWPAVRRRLPGGH
jgi:D-aspartate ligase